MYLRSYYGNESAFIADIVKYLAINQPTVTELSATRIVLEDDFAQDVVRQTILEDSPERLNLAVMVVEHYVLATGRCSKEVYWPALNKSPLRDIAPVLHPLMDE